MTTGSGFKVVNLDPKVFEAHVAKAVKENNAEMLMGTPL